MSGIKLHTPWISTPLQDSVFILSPPFLTLGVIFLFKDYFQTTEEVTTISWVLLVLLVDVAHVYSTLFRTYFHKEVFEKNKTLFLYVPLLTWVSGILLYSMGALVFWRCIAYLAVFHFVRQQYGFMKIYSRGSSVSSFSRWLDLITIYGATLYPILYWHLTGPRDFDWFVRYDFMYVDLPEIATVLSWLYALLLAVYLIHELIQVFYYKKMNPLKNLILVGTLVSWYFGIVYFNSDLIFTALNVLSHGIPYMALIWLYESRKKENGSTSPFALFFKSYGWILFLGFLFLLAFVEEGLWDSMIWKEHRSLFAPFSFLPFLNDNTWLTILIPTLSLPQLTHYILDGYIWRISKKDIHL